METLEVEFVQKQGANLFEVTRKIYEKQKVEKGNIKPWVVCKRTELENRCSVIIKQGKFDHRSSSVCCIVKVSSSQKDYPFHLS